MSLTKQSRRGRPRGKEYPQPDNLTKGFLIAQFGKIGASEEMVVVFQCPYRTIDQLQKSRVLRQVLNVVERDRKQWDAEISQIIGQKIVAGDHHFFRRMADAVEAVSQTKFEHVKSPRYHALDYKLSCYAQGIHFTQKGLRPYLGSKGVSIDSSTLSKIYRWASGAKLYLLPLIPSALGVKPKRSG